MLAYQTNRPRVAGRGSYPHAMLVIIGVHVAAVAVLMSARMEFTDKGTDPPTIVDIIREDDPPPPDPQTEPRATPTTPEPRLTQPPRIVPMPPTEVVPADPLPLPDIGEIVKPIDQPRPYVEPTRAPPVARTGPQLATPADRLKPPYPASKLASGEEAVLRLKLSIDARGRVVAVEAAGPADPAFLNAARRHLLANWRYRPASEGGQAVASTTVITLRFELEG